MGLLSNIGGALKKAATAVVKTIQPVMDPLTVAFVHPIQTAKAIVGPTTVKQVVETHFEQPLSKQITETVIAGAGYATAALGAGAVAAKGVAATAATLVPATVKGKVIAAVAAPVVIGAVIKEPAKTIEAAASLPSGLANVGGNIAGLVADPSIEKAKALVTENPVIVGAAAAAAAIVGAKAILPAIVGAKQIEAVQEQTEAIREVGKAQQPVIVEGAPTTEAPTAPITPKTERVVTTAAKTSGKRKKRSSKAAAQNISQRVNVVVANRAVSTGIRQTHKYLNRKLLIN